MIGFKKIIYFLLNFFKCWKKNVTNYVIHFFFLNFFKLYSALNLIWMQSSIWCDEKDVAPWSWKFQIQFSLIYNKSVIYFLLHFFCERSCRIPKGKIYRLNVILKKKEINLNSNYVIIGFKFRWYEIWVGRVQNFILLLVFPY